MANRKDEAGKIVLDDFEMTSNTPEPPERHKRWGFVSALPSEHLIVYRGGKLRERVSRQGGRCWKRPSDTVAIVPTTLKEVLFRANQITVDNVDVQLRGMVLYCIKDPQNIYKLINFTNRQQAEAKLGRIIADTCRSNAKWLVANMTVEQCIRRRKEEIAAALKTEVARVVGSGGSAGWGVEIVTVDIQDIFIQDDALFGHLQAKFKAEREGEAEMARQTAREQVTRNQLIVERRLAEERHQLTLDKTRLTGEAELATLANQRRQDEETFKLDRFRVEQNGDIVLDRTRRENEHVLLSAEGRRACARIDAEAKAIAAKQETTALSEQLKVESSAAPASLERLFLTQALPRLSEAFVKSARDMRFSVLHTGGSGSANATPLGFLVSQLLDLLDQRLHRTPKQEEKNESDEEE
jgi:flotillin